MLEMRYRSALYNLHNSVYQRLVTTEVVHNPILQIQPQIGYPKTTRYVHEY